MKVQLSIFATALLFAGSSLAEDICKDVNLITNDVSDEICLAISDEAEDCFAKLNFQMQAMDNSSTRLSKKEKKEKTEDLIKAYESAAGQISGSYIEVINDHNGACEHERAELKVWVKEIEKDLNDLRSRTITK